EEAGADYLIYGHIFKTKSKIGKSPKGLNKLKEVINQTELPIIAIGGIKPNNVKEVFDVGADGIAVLSGILLAKNVKNQSYEYYKKSRDNNRINSTIRIKKSCYYCCIQ